MAKGGSSVDLSKLSIEELQALGRDIETEIVSRRETERERVLEQMRELASSVGMTLEDIVKQQKGGVQAKYRHPEKPELTWSGRGKRPAWVNEALAAGKSLDDLTIGRSDEEA
jgi:DNA-binding protein H-NS